MRNVGKEFFAGNSVKVFNVDRKVSYILELPKSSNMGLRDILEIADTNVHEDFLGIVKNHSLSECSFNDLREAEQNTTVPFVLIRGKTQTVLKYLGHSIYSV